MKQRFSPKNSSLLVGLSILIIGIVISNFFYKIQLQKQETELDRVIEVIDNNVQRVINEAYTATKLLTFTINEQGEVENFDATAAKIIENNRIAKNVSLMPSGIISHVYPREGREQYIGFSIFESEEKKAEAIKTIQIGTMFIAGPMMLEFGEMGVAARNPYFIQDEFWGFTTTVFELSDFIEQTGISSYSDIYYFQLSKVNPNTGQEDFFFPIRQDLELKTFSTISFPEGDWKLYAVVINDSEPIQSTFLLMLFFALASITIGVLSHQVFRKPFELEELLELQSHDLLISREEFRKNSELLESVLESPQEISILSVDQNLNYIGFNTFHSNMIKRQYGGAPKLGSFILDNYPEPYRTEFKKQFESAMKGESFNFTGEIEASSGAYLTWENWFNPIINKKGDIVGITVFSLDISEIKKSEEMLEKSLNEKTTLLSEIHHRVKNNLAIVSGLLELQKSEVSDDQVSEIFDRSINRIISIAMVHELMYQSQDLSSINVHSYLEKLIPAISDTMQDQKQNVRFDIEIEEYKLNINQAIPLGLLLNELITNSFKYAFNGRTDNTIMIKLVALEDSLKVRYHDNGKGFPSGVDFDKPENLGLNLIHAQLQQLDAEYMVETDKNFSLDFTFAATERGSHSNFN